MLECQSRNLLCKAGAAAAEQAEGWEVAVETQVLSENTEAAEERLAHYREGVVKFTKTLRT